MRICVLGLWHLGSVTAACLASLGHQVVGFDFEPSRAVNLSKGIAPVFEPSLEPLLKHNLSSGSLRFTSVLAEATRDIDVLWVAADTPIDDADIADTALVMTQIERALAGLADEALVLVCSQLPVGCIRQLERTAAASARSARLRFACCPENLRLGSAVADFLHPSRLVVGVRASGDRQRLQGLLGSITESIEWMSVESAEMTKHAINAFLAVSVTLANELASICEATGADARQVERGLKSDQRIGARAYVSPGGAFSGGTLARDIAFLTRSSREHELHTPLLSSVLPSNDAHRLWPRRQLCLRFAELAHTVVAVWGLTYKSGADTLRRSASVELCDWMLGHGVQVRVHDPLVRQLPRRWLGRVTRHDDPLGAVRGAQALVIATPSPLYRDTSAEQLLQCCEALLVLDPNHHLPQLAPLAASDPRLSYLAVGMPMANGCAP